MKKEPGKIAVIRAMREDDLERIMEIDNLVLGERRPAYWQGKVEMTGKRSPLPSLLSVYTLVNWRDWNLLQFFDAMGFKERRYHQSRIQDRGLNRDITKF